MAQRKLQEKRKAERAERARRAAEAEQFRADREAEAHALLNRLGGTDMAQDVEMKRLAWLAHEKVLSRRRPGSPGGGDG